MLQIVKNMHLRNIHANRISTSVNLSVPTIYKIIPNLEEHDGDVAAVAGNFKKPGPSSSENLSILQCVGQAIHNDPTLTLKGVAKQLNEIALKIS